MRARLACGAVVCQLLLASLAAAASTEPPFFPGAEKKLSMTVKKWQLKLFGGLIIKDDRVERVFKYLEDLPGDMKLRRFNLHGNPKPRARDVHDYYLGWAAQNGFRLLLESRTLGKETGVTEFYHKPGDDGGAFMFQVGGGKLLWIWESGHCPVGPLFGEWFGFPRVEPDLTPPTSATPWTQRGDLPQIDDARLKLRVELDRWEIGSITADLEKRAEKGKIEPPLDAIALAGPEVFKAVRHLWYLTFAAPQEEQDALCAPWVGWADANGWPALAEGSLSNYAFSFQLTPGEGGGLLLTLRAADEVTVIVFDGGPELEAMNAILETAAKAMDAKESSGERK